LPDKNKEEEMPSEISSGMPVITININEMGQMKRMLPRLTQEEQLENTLLQGLIPTFASHDSMSQLGDSKITRKTKFKDR